MEQESVGPQCLDLAFVPRLAGIVEGAIEVGLQAVDPDDGGSRFVGLWRVIPFDYQLHILIGEISHFEQNLPPVGLRLGQLVPVQLFSTFYVLIPNCLLIYDTLNQHIYGEWFFPNRLVKHLT